MSCGLGDKKVEGNIDMREVAKEFFAELYSNECADFVRDWMSYSSETFLRLVDSSLKQSSLKVRC